MTTVIAILILYLLALVPLAYLWINGVEDMKDEPVEYKEGGHLKD
jgi:hypothetical protein